MSDCCILCLIVSNLLCMKKDTSDNVAPLMVGDTVPEDLPFQVFHHGEIQDMSIASFRGKWLVLFFHPGDFTFVCPTELGELASMYDAFQKDGVEIVSMSTDTVFSHKMWHQTSPVVGKVTFPMGSDHRHNLVTLFGVYCEDDGLAYRASIVIDPQGVIRAMEVHDNSVGRSAKELLRKVKASKYVSEHPGQVCPASWNEGDEALTTDIDLIGKNIAGVWRFTDYLFPVASVLRWYVRKFLFLPRNVGMYGRILLPLPVLKKRRHHGFR